MPAPRPYPFSELVKRFAQHALYHESTDPVPDLATALLCALTEQGEADPAELDGIGIPGDPDYDCPAVYGECGYEPY